MAQIKIDIEEWLAELEKLEKESIKKGEEHKNGYTMLELMDMMGFPKSRIIKLIRASYAKNRLSVGRELRTGLCGQQYWSPVYKILPEKKKGK